MQGGDFARRLAVTTPATAVAILSEVTRCPQRRTKNEPTRCA